MKRTELKRTTQMPRGAGPKRSAPKKPKRVRRTGPPSSVMELLARRSGGLCELGIVCLGTAAATDPSHRIAKGMGGTRDPRSNTTANNTHACRPCHNVVEGDPAAAYANGWKIRRGVADPTDVPVLHWVHGWVRLDEAGGWSPALEYGPEEVL